MAAGRLGVLICADSWHPEPYERLRAQGAELIAVPAFVPGAGVWNAAWGGYTDLSVPADVVGDQGAYLQESMPVMLAMHQGIALSIELPQRVTLEVVETEPTMKGQTASSSYKPAMLSNGIRTMVPPHIGTGTRVVVMTADGSYVERAKD